MGPRARAQAASWSASGAEVRTLDDASALDAGERGWDIVVLDGALERERWDRWLVQRVHRVLAEGGLLAISADHLLDVWSVEGLAWLGSRALRQVRRRLAPRGAIPAADRGAFRGRRYQAAALAAMVEGVGFEVVACAPSGHSLPAPLARVLGPLAQRTARRVMVIARRLPSLWGDDRPFPAREDVVSEFRASHAAAIAARDDWRRRHGPASGPSRLDLAPWAGGGALVFSPHPDDEVIGCGGTLLALAERGGAVTIVQVTDGSDSAAFIDEPDSVRRQVRLDEARLVADGLGARELVCLRADNRALRPSGELRDRFSELLSRTRPAVVFAPSFTDIHPDHQTVLRLLTGALATLDGPRPEVALYEVWSVVAPTHVHDVGTRIGRIEELLLMYETALKIDDYVHLVAERLLYNHVEYMTGAATGPGAGLAAGGGYAEVFQVWPADRFLQLAAGHFGAANGASR
jgi:LmbE family N-acetylglucosaminyl deacetylase